jgi:hypothetical protein
MMPTVRPSGCASADTLDDGAPQRRNVAAASVALAQEQAASHRTGLALARWRSGIVTDRWDIPAMPACQTRWHAQLQDRFLAWLEAGGFQQ